MKEYLPSKQFVARVIILTVLAALIFGIYKTALYFKNRSSKNSATDLIIEPGVIQKDSNDNGIPDWEETLWGLDHEKNGAANKEFIVAKRLELARQSGVPYDNNINLSENETLSREFFAIIMSLQQAGNLDDATLTAVSETIGEKIVATPIPDVYNINRVVIAEEDGLETIKYYTDYLNLNVKYKDRSMGDELTFIAAALKNNDPGALKIAIIIGQSYKSFGSDLMKIPTPAKLATVNVSLANNYEKVGQSIEGLSLLLSDPIAGMKAIINYNKYNDLLAEDIQKLTDNFN